MTEARNAGRGWDNGRAGRDGRGSAGRSGCGTVYTPASKSIKYGLCKELEGSVFDYVADEEMFEEDERYAEGGLKTWVDSHK